MSRFADQVLRRQAKEVKLYRLLVKFIALAILALSSVLLITYAAAALYERPGAYTITVPKRDRHDYSICLSERPDFSTDYNRLVSSAATEITNIKGEEIPAEVDSIDGEHNGDNYMAYTFYLKNNGALTLDYQCTMSISVNVNKLAAAVRIRLYYDDPVTGARAFTDYARVGSDGNPEENTTPFASENTVFDFPVSGFKPNDIDKYTVVIWVEGDDPDTLNDKLGGQFKADMEMNVIRTDEGEVSKS